MHIDHSEKINTFLHPTISTVLDECLPVENSDLSKRIQRFCFDEGSAIFHVNEIVWLQDTVNALQARGIDSEVTSKLQAVVNALFKGDMEECPKEFLHIDIIEKITPTLSTTDVSAVSRTSRDIRETSKPMLEKAKTAALINKAVKRYASLSGLQHDLTLVGHAVTHLDLPKMIFMPLFTTEDQVISLLKRCPNLTHLNLRGCYPITATLTYLMLFELCPKIIELNILDCPNYAPTADQIRQNYMRIVHQLQNFAYLGGCYCNGWMPFWGYLN